MMKERERTLEEILAEDQDPVARYKSSVAQEEKKRNGEMYPAWLKYAVIGFFAIASVIVIATNFSQMMQGVGGVLAIILVVGGYFLPSIIAKSRKHHQYSPILLINVFLGWTLLGWFVALVWSVSAVKKD
jgi:hypothetical protein